MGNIIPFREELNGLFQLAIGLHDRIIHNGFCKFGGTLANHFYFGLLFGILNLAALGGTYCEKAFLY